MISLLRVNLLKILKSSGFLISIIFITFFLSFAPKAFGNSFNETIPNATKESINISIQVSSAIIITGVLLMVITAFGESYVKIKLSLIYKNSLLNSRPKYQFYISTITPIVLYTLLIFTYSLLLTYFLDLFNLLNSNGRILRYINIKYEWFIWSIIWTIILGISISLLISSFVKNINVYTSVMWAYLFLIFFFGGSSVPIFLIRGDNNLDIFMYLSFSIPNTFSNFLFINSLSGDFKYDIIGILDICIPPIISILLLSLKWLIKK